jgi:hypothetical protein
VSRNCASARIASLESWMRRPSGTAEIVQPPDFCQENTSAKTTLRELLAECTSTIQAHPALPEP